MLSQKSLKTVSTAPDSDEAHAALATAQALAPSMTFGQDGMQGRSSSTPDCTRECESADAWLGLRVISLHLSG